MSNDSIVPFDFQGHNVRVVIIDGEPWWVIVDVCKALEIENTYQVAQRLENEDTRQARVLDARGIEQNANVVNEAGLYEIIIRSDKPNAKPFRRWVVKDVLPSIRKTGKFEIEQKDLTPAEYLLAQAQRFVEMERATRELAVQQGYQRNLIDDLNARVAGIEQRTDWLTALAFAIMMKLPDTSNKFCQKLGRLAGKHTRAEGLEPQKVKNESFFQVNSYPVWALEKAFDEM